MVQPTRIRTGSWVAIFAPLIVFSVLDVVRGVLRPRFGTAEHGLISGILGWLPNYLAGLGFVLIVLATLSLVDALGGAPVLTRYRGWLIGSASLAAAAGLIGWELAQLDGNLVFDVADIWASIAGAATGWLIALAQRDKDRTAEDETPHDGRS